MKDAELFSFMGIFNDVRRVFPLRGDAHDLQQVGAAYFKAMQRFPLQAVADGADAWMTKGTKFPKPAEWIDHIPRKAVVSTIPVLSDAERLAYLRAETLGYEDDPCHCEPCRTAGVDHRFLRFVPEFDEYDRDVRARIGDRLVTRGHWAHGVELARWYVARDAFLAKAHELRQWPTTTGARAGRASLEQKIEQIFEKRPKKPTEPEA